MNLMKCPNGHHYDASRFSSCPFCGMEGVNVGPDQTTVPLDVPVSQPGPSVATEPLSTAIPDDDDRTLPVTADMLDGATEKSAPVVGWLVCTEGVNKGTDYRLHQGRNFVGRSSEMDVCILGDNTVSRSSHAIVVYDPRSNVYLAQPGSSKELFYVNDKLMQSGLRCCIKEYFPSGLLQGRTPDGALILADEENRPEYEEGKQQFIEEACALQELRENISVVDILDFFEENGTAYFAMELIEGCNLRVFRKNHNPKQTLKMALQMLFLLGSSLAEVHRFGMIHGDISPENILITQDGEIKLIDFGAARSFRQGSDNKERKIYLKPNYAPYEQYTQKPCQGPWTDIYALAATFYFIVSGRKMLDALSRAKGASYPPLHELCPAVSRQLSDVIDKALAFDYHDRYRRMLDFLDALEQVVRPEDYDIDLGALMPKSKASKQAEIHVETSDDSEKMCQVEEQNMPEPKRLAAFFHPKKRRLAYLELTMQKSGGHISRRRWIIEPNRTVKVGRLATSDVMMPADNQISRNHCEVFYNEPKREFIVRDLSKYGTYLADGKPMEKEKSYTLKDGDIFCVVSPEYTFKVVIET